MSIQTNLEDCPMACLLADRPKQAAAERAKPGITAGVAREEAFKRATAKTTKAKKAKRKPRIRQKGNKNGSRRQWKNAGRGQDLETGEYVGGTEVNGEEVVDAPTSLMCKYVQIGNTMRRGMGDLPRAIASAVSNRGANGGVAVTTNYLQLQFQSRLTMVQFNHEAESRVNAIQLTALDTSGKRYYDIETVGGGGSHRRWRSCSGKKGGL